MRATLLFPVIATFAGTSIGATAGGAQVRAGLPVDPATLYAEMFRLAERGDWEPLGRAAEVLEPWLLEVDRTTSEDSGHNVRQAIEAGQSSVTAASLTVFIVNSVGVLLTRATEATDPSVRRAHIREAFAEALVLSEGRKRTHFRLWSEVERQFRVAHQLSGAVDGSFGDSCTVIVALLKSAIPNHKEPA